MNPTRSQIPSNNPSLRLTHFQSLEIGGSQLTLFLFRHLFSMLESLDQEVELSCLRWFQEAGLVCSLSLMAASTILSRVPSRVHICERR